MGANSEGPAVVGAEAPRPAGWNARAPHAVGNAAVDVVRGEVQFSGRGALDLCETTLTVPLDAILRIAAHHLNASAAMLAMAKARGVGLVNGG